MKYFHSITFQIQLVLQLLGIIVFFSFPLSPFIQALISGIALCIIGIPHGANDYLYREDRSRTGLVKFLSYYIGIMAIYLMVWWVAPLLALAIFFLISLHHFGQSNFENQNVWHAPSLLWGIWILFFPVLLHFNEAVQIFQSMISFTIYSGDLVSDRAPLALWQVATAGIFAIAYVISLFYYERQDALLCIVQFVLVTIWYLITPLLFGFIIVFCLWHATQSLQHQAAYFKQLFSKSTREFFSAMLPFSVVALASFCVYVAVFGFNISFSFILLSLISLPHVLVMHVLYKKGVSTHSATVQTQS